MSQTRELSPADSIEREGPSIREQKKIKSRRPPNTAFRQQRLKAWQPILTPKTVLPLFFVIGIIFAPIGGLLLWASAMVQELSIEYQGCSDLAPTGAPSPIPAGRVTTYFRANNASTGPSWNRSLVHVPIGVNSGRTYTTTACSLQFDIPIDIGPPVFLYYRLTDFYQNHRRYVKSFDQDQLNGKFRSNSSIIGSNCDPLQLNGSDKDPQFAYYPCGLIANSFFNDTIMAPMRLNGPDSSGSAGDVYNMTTKGIAWSSDASLYGKSAYQPNQVAPPPNWMKRYPDGYNHDTFPLPDLHDDEAFQVWMRTAGLPTFSKLALRSDDTMMRRGRYQITIYDDFNVTAYGGTKAILISTRTVMGGRNPFLGIAYVVVGGICVVLGAIFLATHLIKPRKLGDHTYLTWNNDQSNSATASGRTIRANDAA